MQSALFVGETPRHTPSHTINGIICYRFTSLLSCDGVAAISINLGEHLLTGSDLQEALELLQNPKQYRQELWNRQ